MAGIAGKTASTNFIHIVLTDTQEAVFIWGLNLPMNFR